VTVVDVPSARVIARPSLTGVGLASLATARGLLYGVNTVTHELAVLDPGSEEVSRFGLSAEPAAVAAAEDSGAVYVLTSRSDSILRIDPTDGSELGKVIVSNRSGHVGTQPGDVTSLRPRLVLDPADDSVFATLPEAGTLAAVTDDSFPVMAHEIPYAEVGDLLVADSIPDVLRPGGVGGDRFNARGH
jgi:DNA-binding beta-propeller fold protein YncE